MALVQRADSECKQQNPLPACTGFNKLRQQRDGLKQAWTPNSKDFLQRETYVALSDALENAAILVLAGAACRKEGASTADPLCVALIAAEATPSAGGGIDQSIGRLAVTKVDIERVASTSLSATGDPILGRVGEWQSSCPSSKVYISPSGSINTNPEGKPTICVDISDFAISRRLLLEVVQGGRATTIEAWPGEPVGFESVPGAIVRLTVSGFPAGHSLRVAAGRGSGAAAAPSIFELSSRAFQHDRDKAQIAKKTALNALAQAVSGDPDIKKLLAELHKSVESIAKASPIARQRVRSLAQRLIAKLQTVVAAVTNVEVRDIATRKLPASPSDQPDSIKKVEAVLSSFSADLTTMADKIDVDADKVAADWQKFQGDLSSICAVAHAWHTMIDAQVLIPGPRQQVVDYDYSAGLISSPARVDLTDDLYLRVSRVPAGSGLTVAVDDIGLVRRQLLLVGAGDAGAQTVASAPARTRTDRATSATGIAARQEEDQEYILARSQVIPLGRLDAGRGYELSVCGGKGACASGSAGEQDQTLIARHRVIVHGDSYLGLRMGVGMNLLADPLLRAEQVPQSSVAAGGGKYETQEDGRLRFAVPALVAWYPWGRDVVDRIPSHSFAISAGFDVLSVSTAHGPTSYLALSEDFFGLGITGGAMIGWFDSVVGEKGAYSGASPPATIKRTWGGFFGLTTDFDIFELTFRKILETKMPTIGTQGGP